MISLDTAITWSFSHILLNDAHSLSVVKDILICLVSKSYKYLRPCQIHSKVHLSQISAKLPLILNVFRLKNEHNSLHYTCIKFNCNSYPKGEKCRLWVQIRLVTFVSCNNSSHSLPSCLLLSTVQDFKKKKKKEKIPQKNI